MKISKPIFILNRRKLLTGARSCVASVVSLALQDRIAPRADGVREILSPHSRRPSLILTSRLFSLSPSSKTGNKQSTGICPDSASMDGSPHPSAAAAVGGIVVNSPVTPPSSVIRKFSNVSPTSSDRVELLQHLALSPAMDFSSIRLTQQQLDFCKEALVRLLKKLNVSSRNHRRIIDREFDVLLSDRLQVNKILACTTIGRLESNLPKNRYLDVLPYDDTRVLLEEIANGRTSSYINASYVVDPTHESLPKFIATQGPLPNTNADFWEMVVQQQCPVIVMLTGLVDESNKMVKCDNYFPAKPQESLTYGRFRITNKGTTISQNAAAYRLLEIEHVQPGAAAPIPVLHMQLDWPDYGIPTSTASVREMVRTLYEVPSNFGPFVVHCSAGIGRTGTYCTIDHTLRRIILGDMTAVDLESTVRRFRQQRLGMVQTREQYAFCYKAVIAELQDLLTTRWTTDKSSVDSNRWPLNSHKHLLSDNERQQPSRLQDLGSGIVPQIARGFEE
ncbi:hypothetical protein GOP47_0014546 [Adiantum capillus-veneris]|uniref:protein-tyrosine-phosphatase n=1 Tax=Adiantum capillus-veneris TaxID=13818 RepID=A0A9D4UMU8_ADICA|nr:hypothetical protein GOP47_0014546 [Adiantum capillus-veneris]